MSARMLPGTSPESEPFWAATRERRLVLQWCTACEAPLHFPRALCPRCAGSSLEWRDASGDGVVYAATVENRPEAMGESDPYAVVLVDLVEGVRLMGNLLGCAPEDVAIGIPVRIAWEPLDDGRHLPVFELRKE